MRLARPGGKDRVAWNAPSGVAKCHGDDDDVIYRPDYRQELGDEIDRARDPDRGDADCSLCSRGYCGVATKSPHEHAAIGEQADEVACQAGRQSAGEKEEGRPRGCQQSEGHSEEDQPGAHAVQSLNPAATSYRHRERIADLRWLPGKECGPECAAPGGPRRW